MDPAPSADFLNRVPTGNALAYCKLTLEAIPHSGAPLTDKTIDIAEAWFREQAPRSIRKSATSTNVWWMSADPALPSTAVWIGWMVPGPLLSLEQLVPVRPRHDYWAIHFRGLASMWRRATYDLKHLGQSLQVERCRLGFAIQTNPVDREHAKNVVDIDFDGMVAPTGGIDTESTSSWSYVGEPHDVATLTPRILEPPLTSLLGHFSYRHAETAIGQLVLD